MKRGKKLFPSTVNIPVQKIVPDSSAISREEIEKCSCYRKGFCVIRDDKCIPNSLKCIKNKKTHTYSYAPSGLQTETAKRTYRSRDEYNPFVDERYGFNKNIKTLNTDGESVELYVFKGFLNLAKQYTTDYYLMIKDIQTERGYRILVAYNSRTDRYYISETQLKWLHKRNVYPKTTFHTSNDGSIPLIALDFQEFSKLAMYGYSAGKNGLKTSERRKILKYVLDEKLMRGYEIVEHLQGLISLREERTDRDFSTAINNWREDIKFVNDYKITNIKNFK